MHSPRISRVTIYWRRRASKEKFSLAWMASTNKFAALQKCSLSASNWRWIFSGSYLNKSNLHDHKVTATIERVQHGLLQPWAAQITVTWWFNLIFRFGERRLRWTSASHLKFHDVKLFRMTQYLIENPRTSGWSNFEDSNIMQSFSRIYQVFKTKFAYWIKIKIHIEFHLLRNKKLS